MAFDLRPHTSDALEENRTVPPRQFEGRGSTEHSASELPGLAGGKGIAPRDDPDVEDARARIDVVELALLGSRDASEGVCVVSFS